MSEPILGMLLKESESRDLTADELLKVLREHVATVAELSASSYRHTLRVIDAVLDAKQAEAAS